MKIDFNTKIKNLDGTAIKNKKKDLTARYFATEALLALADTEKNLSGEEKFKRGQLAEKIYMKDVVDLTVEEISLVKKMVGKVFNSLVVLRMYKILENKNEKK